MTTITLPIEIPDTIDLDELTSIIVGYINKKNEAFCRPMHCFSC